MISLAEITKLHEDICNEGRSLIKTKGADYNREKQLSGDTLYNMRVAKQLGINETNTQGVLTRMSDKMMRLISLAKDPTVQNEVKDESVRDTIRDLINYSVYLYAFYEEERKLGKK